MKIIPTVHREILDGALLQSLWEVHDLAFKVKEDCIQEQRCYDETSFKAALRDPDYVKFIIQDETGRALGYEMATHDLEKARITYVNPERLKKKFPVQATEGRLWYITSLAVHPDVQNQDLSAPIVELITDFAIENRVVFAFDYAWDENPKFPMYVLHQVTKAIKRKMRENKASFVDLGGQHYGAIVIE